jgi:transcription elongation factor SPT5
MALNGPSDTGILSAFTRDTVPGVIYIEAFTITAVKDALRGVSGIIRSHLGPLIDLVPLDDRIPLLKMPGSISDAIKPGAFARIKDRGLYRNDLAVIKEFDETTLVARVLLVPRQFEPGRLGKRKRVTRPAPALFDPEVVKRIYGKDSVQQLNQVWSFKNSIYCNGLVEKDLIFYLLSDGGPKPEPSEIDLFLQSRDPWVLNSMNTSGILLHARDRVQVVAGTFRGLTGRLLGISENNIVTVQADDADPQSQDVYLSEVCRLFRLGDEVDVLYGKSKGAVGFIIELDGASAVIYVRNAATVASEQLGQEVSSPPIWNSPHSAPHAARGTHHPNPPEIYARHKLLGIPHRIALGCREISCQYRCQGSNMPRNACGSGPL